MTETPSAPPRDRQFVQSLERGLSVIRALSAPEPQTLSDVARATGLTRAASRRFLLTLHQLGYVDLNGTRFSLTPQVLELGYAYLSSLTLPEVAQPHLERLVEEVHESSSVSVLDGTDVVYVARVPTRRIMHVSISVGTRFPAYATSMGRVLLAGLAPARLDAVLAASDLRALTPETIHEERALRAEIDRVRKQGWAVVDQELEAGLRSVAAPIRDRDGEVVAAINVSAHASRTGLDDVRAALLPPLLATAEAGERDLSAARAVRPPAAGSRSRWPRPRPGRSSATCRGRGRSGRRQREPEPAALAHRRVDAEGAAVALDDALGDREAQAGAGLAGGGAEALEGLEEARALGRVDAGAVVDDLHAHVTLDQARPHDHARSAGRGELHRVGQQVAQRGLDVAQLGVRVDVGRHVDLHLGAVLVDRRAQLGQHADHRVGDDDRVAAHPGGLRGPRVAQQVVDEPAHALDAAGDVVQEQAAALVDRVPVALGEQAAEAGDRPQRLLEVVGRDGREALELAIGAQQPLVGVADRVLGRAPLGEVAGDLGEAQEHGGVVAYGGDDDVGPEARAVLADAPALLLVAAGGGRQAQLLGGMVAGLVLVGVEQREVPADDLVGGVALDVLGARVPAHDVAAGIQQEDRVVADAEHEPAELLELDIGGRQRAGLLAQALLGEPPVAEVADDLAEADRRPVGLADRRDDDAGPEARAVAAHAPALVLDAALAARDLQQVGRPAGGAVLVGVEHREVRADRLAGGVALQALRAQVPRGDRAAVVEQQDRVVADGLDEQGDLVRAAAVVDLGHRTAVAHPPGHRST